VLQLPHGYTLCRGVLGRAAAWWKHVAKEADEFNDRRPLCSRGSVALSSTGVFARAGLKPVPMFPDGQPTTSVRRA
jgi:hypothetical protein